MVLLLLVTSRLECFLCKNKAEIAGVDHCHGNDISRHIVSATEIRDRASWCAVFLLLVTLCYGSQTISRWTEAQNLSKLEKLG